MDFSGDKAIQPASVFLSAARALGFHVRVNRRIKGKGSAPVRIDATEAAAWKLSLGASTVDPDTRSANCRHLIQAVVLDAISRG